MNRYFEKCLSHYSKWQRIFPNNLDALFELCTCQPFELQLPKNAWLKKASFFCNLEVFRSAAEAFVGQGGSISETVKCLYNMSNCGQKATGAFFL